MWHIYTMEYYSAIKRNEMEVFVVRWMDLESVIQSEVKPTEEREGEGRGRHSHNMRHCLSCKATDSNVPRLMQIVIRKGRERHLIAQKG